MYRGTKRNLESKSNIFLFNQKPNNNELNPTNKAIKKLAMETINPSFLLSANNGKSPSPLVAIPAAISAEKGKLGITMNATATDIIPPQPGNTPIIAAINITKLVDDIIHESKVSEPTTTSITKFATNNPIKT